MAAGVKVGHEGVNELVIWFSRVAHISNFHYQFFIVAV